jgi:ABC-type multidrug transport system permease subunit
VRILQELKKNALSLVRSPAALVTLVIGPLLLLLLTGITLSGTEPNGIRIGVTGPGAGTVNLNATVDSFSTLDGCLAALRDQQIHLCIEFGKFYTSSGIPQGTVTLHVDESRQRISSLVLEEVSKQLGVESSKIRVEAVKGLLDQFGNIASFMSEKRTDLVKVRQEALSLKSDVTARRVRLEEQQQVYRAAYYPVRDGLRGVDVSLRSSQADLGGVIAAASSSLDAIDSAASQLPNATLNISGFNLSMPVIDLSPLRQQLTLISNDLNSSRNDSASTSASIEVLLSGLEDIDVQIDGDINASREYESKIDTGVTTIDALLVQLDADIEKLSSMDPTLGKRIDTPIVQDVKTLFTDLLPIQTGFSQLFCIVVVFISMLFGAIVTLIEINSRAVLRNTLTPTGEGWTMIALCVTSLIVVWIQAGVLLVVADTLLSVDVKSSLAAFAIVGTLLALIFINLGMAIALRLRKQQSSILVATFSALIVLLFSDVMTAIELMPVSVSRFVQYNPLITASSLLKQVQLFGQDLVFTRLQPLLIWLVVSVMAVILAYKIYKSRISRW